MDHDPMEGQAGHSGTHELFPGEIAQGGERKGSAACTRLEEHDALLLLGELGCHGGDQLIPKLPMERVPWHPAVCAAPVFWDQ